MRFRFRSAGKKQEFEGVSYTIEELTENRSARGATTGQARAQLGTLIVSWQNRIQFGHAEAQIAGPS